MQTFGPYIILLDPASPEEQTEKLRKSCETYFDVFHDAESEFMTYLIFGESGSEAYFRRYYHDETHVFHADMGHGLNGAGAAAVCDIIEKVETEHPVYEKKLQWELYDVFAGNGKNLGRDGADRTVLGIQVEEFVEQNADKTLAQALGDEHFWYAYYGIDSLGLSRHTYYWIRRRMDPPICYPSGSHLTMDELLGFTVSRLWNGPVLFEDGFIEIVEKADAWLKAWHARTGS